MFFRWFSYDSLVGSYPAWKLCLGSPPRENSSSCCCENPMGWPLMAACSPWSAKGNWFSKTSLGQLGVLTHDWWRTSKISRMKTDGFVRGSKSETWEVQTCSGFDHQSWGLTTESGILPINMGTCLFGWQWVRPCGPVLEGVHSTSWCLPTILMFGTVLGFDPYFRGLTVICGGL